MSKNTTNRLMPLLMAVCVVVGIMVGTFYANHFSGNRLNIINSSGNKLNNLLHIIDDQYVDTVNINELVEKAMPQILAELDPHSVYISARDGEIANDDLRGSFFGIGIEFTIRQDTIRVQNVIGNGPAERAGVLAGDKIVEVDDSIFVGKKVTNEEAMHRLKGPKDTKVKLGILRYGEKKLHHITITRGEIPTKSVTACYMLDEDCGYIKIRNFGENTYPELLIALAKLSQQNFSNLVIDLRGNTGHDLFLGIAEKFEIVEPDTAGGAAAGSESHQHETGIFPLAGIGDLKGEDHAFPFAAVFGFDLGALDSGSQEFLFGVLSLNAHADRGFRGKSLTLDKDHESVFLAGFDREMFGEAAAFVLRIAFRDDDLGRAGSFIAFFPVEIFGDLGAGRFPESPGVVIERVLVFRGHIDFGHGKIIELQNGAGIRITGGQDLDLLDPVRDGKFTGDHDPVFFDRQFGGSDQGRMELALFERLDADVGEAFQVGRLVADHTFHPVGLARLHRQFFQDHGVGAFLV